MKVLSVNIGEEKIVSWRGKPVKTGIFKYPVDEPIYLDKEDVKNDSVCDRRYHGGIDKACYLYNGDTYPFWKEKYPLLDWTYGMMGENITIQNLDESKIHIGNQYKIGDAIIEVAQPRQPCFKLGIRFGTQKIVKDFVNAPYPGIYVRVIVSGKVNLGDSLIPLKIKKENPTVLEVYEVLYGRITDELTIKKVLNCNDLALNTKNDILKKIKF